MVLTQCSMFKNKNNVVQKASGYEQKEEWVLDTNGVNLLEILRYPGVDSSRNNFK